MDSTSSMASMASMASMPCMRSRASMTSRSRWSGRAGRASSSLVRHRLRQLLLPWLVVLFITINATLQHQQLTENTNTSLNTIPRVTSTMGVGAGAGAGAGVGAGTWKRTGETSGLRCLHLRGGVGKIIISEEDEMGMMAFLPPGQQICQRHNIRRSVYFLRRDWATGQFVCNKKKACNTTRDLAMCTRHGKMRQRVHLRQGRHGLICKPPMCKPFLIGACHRCGVECSDKIRGSLRVEMHPRLTRYLPKYGDFYPDSHHQKFYLCNRCNQAFEYMVDELMNNTIAKYQDIVHERLHRRLPAKSNASRTVKGYLEASIRANHLVPELVGFNWTETPPKDWPHALSLFCSATGLGPPRFRAHANHTQLERIRRMIGTAAPRFAVPHHYSITINGTTYTRQQKFRDTAYYAIGGRKTRSIVRKEMGKKKLNYHRVMLHECLGSVVGMRNFRKFAEQQAARLALVELMGRRLGEGLDKFALAVIDSIMPGSELERRAVQRLFKGKKNANRVRVAATQYVNECSKKMTQFFMQRVIYDSGYGQD